jgi:putative transposase
MKQSSLKQGGYYHIYNCGINGCNIFKDKFDYEHFLCIYEKYINPVADTFAWVLMGNHFHLLVRVKENIVYKYLNSDKSIDADRFQELKWETQELPIHTNSDSFKQVNPTLHFSHLFNAYSKFFNKKYNRQGSLFERAFKRKLINSNDYFRQLVLYIHNNPVHHGFCEHKRCQV